MASGGARARSGSPPDQNSLRSASRDWVNLPAAGYEGPVPEWPLVDPTPRESEVWETFWRKPQAEQWAEQQMEWQVAFYVRRLVEAEVRDSAANLSTLVRQLADDLGLTKAGMDRNLWRIRGDRTPPPATEGSTGEGDATVIPIGSSRDRFKKG